MMISKSKFREMKRHMREKGTYAGRHAHRMVLIAKFNGIV